MSRIRKGIQDRNLVSICCGNLCWPVCPRGNDFDPRYDLPRGWHSGDRNHSGDMACVYCRERANGGGRKFDGADRKQWECFHSIDTEFGCDARGDILHSRVSLRRWNGEQGILVSSEYYADDNLRQFEAK